MKKQYGSTCPRSRSLQNLRLFRELAQSMTVFLTLLSGKCAPWGCCSRLKNNVSDNIVSLLLSRFFRGIIQSYCWKQAWSGDSKMGAKLSGFNAVPGSQWHAHVGSAEDQFIADIPLNPDLDGLPARRGLITLSIVTSNCCWRLWGQTTSLRQAKQHYDK